MRSVPPTKLSQRWLAASGLLLASPGDWQLIAEGVSKSTYIALAADRMAALRREDGFRFSVRATDIAGVKHYDIYGRYRPEDVMTGDERAQRIEKRRLRRVKENASVAARKEGGPAAGSS